MENENTIASGAEEEILENSAIDEDASEFDTENVGDNDPNEDDEDFEYDDEGNIIIPEGDDADEGEPKAEIPAEKADEPSDTDKRFSELERHYGELEKYSKVALEALGIETDDVIDGMISLAAETEGVTREGIIERVKAEEALVKKDYEAIAKKDLDTLKGLWPVCSSYKSIQDMPNVKQFAKFRDLGLSAKEAFAAANPDLIRGGKAPAGSKAHLHTVVPKGANGNTVTMSKSELARFRELFPEKSVKEIVTLYNKTKLND